MNEGVKDFDGSTVWFYAFCPKCHDFYVQATSLSDAHAQCEEHEKAKHGGKPVSSFGKSWLPVTSLEDLKWKPQSSCKAQ